MMMGIVTAGPEFGVMASDAQTEIYACGRKQWGKMPFAIIAAGQVY